LIRIVAVCAGLLSAAAYGNILIWEGVGTNANWNSVTNWGGATPGNGDTLVFPAAAANRLNTNNIASLTLKQIRFTGAGGGYDIRGNAFTLTNSILATNTSGANIIENNITLATSDVLIVVSNGVSLTLGGTNSGSVGVNKAGLGTLIYQSPGDNTYLGTTLVSGGTLQLNVNGFNAFGGPLVIGDGTGAGSPTVQDLQGQEISEVVPITINQNGTLNLTNFSETIGPSLTFSNGTITTGSGTLYLSANSTITVTNGSVGSFYGNLNTGSGPLNLRGNGYLEMYATVSGSANIVQNDSVTTYWSGANTYAGNYTANGDGYVDLNNSLALGNINNTLTLNGLTYVAIYGNINITNQSLIINSTNLNFALFVSGTSTNSWQANFTLGSACSVDVLANCAMTLNINSSITGSAGITKIGPGSLTLSGPANVSSYTGDTIVNEGTLFLNSINVIRYGTLRIGDGAGGAQADIVRYLYPSCIYGGPGGSTVVITNSGWLDLNGFSDDVGPIYMDGAIITTGAGTLTLFPPLATISSANGGSTINGNFQFSSAISVNNTLAITNDLYLNASVSSSGNCTLNKTGPGVLSLTASNSYTGTNIIQQGWISIENGSALGSMNNSTIVSNGATLAMSGNFAVTNASLTLNGPGEPTWGALDSETYGGTNLWVGPITLNADSTIVPFQSGSTLRIIGQISGAGGLIEFDGSEDTNSVVSLEGATANTYAGTTTVTSGMLLLNKPSGVLAVPGNLVIAGSSSVARLASSLQTANSADVLISSGGLFDISTFYTDLATLHGSGTVNFGAYGWIVIGLNSGSSEFDGSFTGTGYTNGVTVAKLGYGTFTIGGNSTYKAGITHVYYGKLVINGSQPLIPVTVDAGATLGGSGTVGTITASGSISPGSSPGILTSSNVTFTSSGQLTVELTGPTPGTGYDQLNVRGTNNLASAMLNLNLAFTTPVALGQQFTIINNDGADPITGIFAGYPEGATFLQNGYTVAISYVGGTGNDVVLTLTSVPGAVAGSTVTSGNGNAAIDPNECDALRLGITNTSGMAMTGVSATLSSADPNVLVTQPASTYADVPSGGMSTNATPFQISVLPSFLCGNAINLNLTVTSASHGAFTLPVVLKSGETASSPSRYDNNNTFSIPDIGSIESTNVVAGFSGPVMKVAVSLYLTHTRDQDLTNISLIGPDGTTVMLSAANGGSGQNYGSATNDASRTTFDDAAATAITSGTAPFVGTFRPQSPLSAFNGSTSVNGNWRLHLADGYSGSLGTLRAWSLFLYPLTCGSGGGACALCADGTLYNNTLDASSAVQIGRLVRNCVISTCGSVKLCPGLFDSVPRYYQAYPFYNGQSNACITVALTDPPCNLMSVAYLGTFDPVNLCANYLGDAGNDTGNGNLCGLSGALTYSFTVPSNSVFVVTVNEVGYGLCGNPYTLSVSGGDCRPILNIVPASSSKVDLNWPTVAGGYNLEATPSLSVTNWTGVTNEPMAISNRFNVTNSSVSPTNRFYRLHKP
jgi:autotransporter-associated beta strand protein